MKRGIVITTSEATKDFLADCLASLPQDYSVLLVGNGGYDPSEIIDDGMGLDIEVVVNDWNGFELGGIKRGAERFDEFVHLMDTCVLKEPEVVDFMFSAEWSICFCRHFFSYLGKYQTKILKQIGIPKITTKEEAIECEHLWHRKYKQADPAVMVLQPELPIETDVFVEKYGRKNMVLENDFIIKYKGTWYAKTQAEKRV